MSKSRYKPCRHIDCPWCGNSVLAWDKREKQKCKWCKRLYTVSAPNWEPECQDFDAGFDFNNNVKLPDRIIDGHAEYDEEN